MKTIKQAVIFFFMLTVIVGGVYPAIIFGVSQVFFSEKAKGGIVNYKDKAIGANLIAQEFTSDKYFWGRPSAASFNGAASSGSNYSLTNADYQKTVEERKSKGLDYELLTNSGSGLDPHITPKAAFLQMERIAHVRHLDVKLIEALVVSSTEGRQFGFLGEERVNVLRLNLKLETLAHE